MQRSGSKPSVWFRAISNKIKFIPRGSKNPFFFSGPFRTFIVNICNFERISQPNNFGLLQFPREIVRRWRGSHTQNAPNVNCRKRDVQKIAREKQSLYHFHSVIIFRNVDAFWLLHKGKFEFFAPAAHTHTYWINLSQLFNIIWISSTQTFTCTPINQRVRNAPAQMQARTHARQIAMLLMHITNEYKRRTG